MKIKIGGREQIANATLLVPPGEDAWLEFSADTWNVKIHVIFQDSEEDKYEGFTLEAHDDHALLTLKNWKNALPSAIEPFSLGVTNGRSVFFVFTGYAVGGFKRLDFSFFWGDNHAK